MSPAPLPQLQEIIKKQLFLVAILPPLVNQWARSVLTKLPGPSISGRDLAMRLIVLVAMAMVSRHKASYTLTELYNGTPYVFKIWMSEGMLCAESLVRVIGTQP